MSSESVDVKVVDRRWWAQQGQTPDTAGVTAEEGWQPEKPSYVQELEQRLAEQERLAQEYLAKYRAAAREFEETRARLRKEQAREVERARRTFLADLLEVADNLDRAIDAARSSASAEAVLAGVEMVRRQFLAKLEAIGVRRLEAEGARFDPSQHEAVTVVPTSDPAKDGVVVGTIAAGYAIGDEVLRPARVAVARLATDTVTP